MASDERKNLLGRHSVHTGFLQAAANVRRHGNRAVRTEQLDHIFDQRTVVRDDMSFGDARHRNAISVSRRAIFAGSWHEKVASEKLLVKSAGNNLGGLLNTRAGSLKIDRYIQATLEPNDEVPLRHLTMLPADCMAIPLAEIFDFDDGGHEEERAET